VTYKNIIGDILKINDIICFVTICDAVGNISETGHYDSTKNLLSLNESITLLKHAVKSWKLCNLFSTKIGQGKYTIFVYEKLKWLTIDFRNDHLIYMIVDVNSDHEKIINDVLKIEEKYFEMTNCKD